MSQYRVVKQALPAQLLLMDGTRIEGTLFLAAESPLHSGPQSVGELMAEAERTLPFHDPDGRFLLVGKSGVAAVLNTLPGPSDDDLMERIPVAARLAGGHRLDGHYLAEKGAGVRLSDALNTGDRWFRLETFDALAWVSTDHVLTIEPG